MPIKVMRTGDSRGIRIPKQVLGQCHVEDALELAIRNNELSLLTVEALFRSAGLKGFIGEDGEYGCPVV